MSKQGRVARAAYHAKREAALKRLNDLFEPKLPDRSPLELIDMKRLALEKAAEAQGIFALHNVFASRATARGRRLVVQVGALEKRGRGKRKRAETALVAAEEIVAMNRAQRRKHLGERGLR